MVPLEKCKFGSYLENGNLFFNYEYVTNFKFSKIKTNIEIVFS